MLEKPKERLRGIRISRYIACAAVAVVFIAATGIVYSVSGTKNPLVWIVSALVFVGLTTAYLCLAKYGAGTPESVENESFLGSMTLELIVKMPFPVIICNSAGNIIWYLSLIHI